jgi:hypothetical protein
VTYSILPRKEKVVICPNCGKENEKSFNFCKWCGHKLETDSLPPIVSSPTNTSPLMKHCLNCGKEIHVDWLYCNFCGARQEKSSPKSESRISPWTIVFIVAFIVLVIGGVLLVPTLAPDIADDKPDEIIFLGCGFIVMGLVAWALEWSGKVRFVGRASCCMFFPFIGLIIFLFGIFALFRGMVSPAIVLPTPSRYRTPLPATKLPPKPTKVQIDYYGLPCVSWRTINSTDIDSYLCVYGIVTNYGPYSNRWNFIQFSPYTDALRIVDFNYYYYSELNIGNCVSVYGKVRDNGAYLMVTPDKNKEDSVRTITPSSICN